MMRKIDKKGRKTSSYGKFVIIFICYMHKLEICQDKLWLYRHKKEAAHNQEL